MGAYTCTIGAGAVDRRKEKMRKKRGATSVFNPGSYVLIASL